MVPATCCSVGLCPSCVEASRQYAPPSSSWDDAEPQGKRLPRGAVAHRFCCRRRCLHHGLCKLITQQRIAAASFVLNGRKLFLLMLD